MGELTRIAVLQNIDGSSFFRLVSSQTYTIGRGEQANLRAADTTVSRVHATVFWDGRSWVIVDCSTYGTYVNGKAIHKHRLVPGDLIRVSEKYQWEFSEQAAPLAEPNPDQITRMEIPTDETVRLGASQGKTFHPIPAIIGTSKSTHSLRSHVSKTAEGTAAVLIRGELGVGKYHIAQAIHAASQNRSKPCVLIDCCDADEAQWNTYIVNPPSNLNGAFPGTIILRRVGNLTIPRQEQLLAKLAEFSRLSREGQAVPRIIATSERNLEELVDRGEFLTDLLVRIGVVQILVDPLRERKEDISELARHYLRISSAKYGKSVKALAPDAVTTLQSYSWPGNVQELKNTIDRAVLLSTGTTISDAELKKGISEVSGVSYSMAGLSIEDVEKLHIDATLKATGWKKSRTASILGIERSTLDRKIKRYKLIRPPKAFPRAVERVENQ